MVVWSTEQIQQKVNPTKTKSIINKIYEFIFIKFSKPQGPKYSQNTPYIYIPFPFIFPHKILGEGDSQRRIEKTAILKPWHLSNLMEFRYPKVSKHNPPMVARFKLYKAHLSNLMEFCFPSSSKHFLFRTLVFYYFLFENVISK